MDVTVINENNIEVSIDPPETIVIEVDQGKAGRGIASVTYEPDGAVYYLEITYTDGTTQLVGPIPVDEPATLVNYYIKASAAITKGDLVMFTGAVGASGVLQGAPASAGLAEGLVVMGIASETMATNGFGYVTSFGLVQGINTTGSAVGETWATGDILYYNPAYVGKLTNVRPTSPAEVVVVAAVTNASAGNGSLFVRVSFYPKLTELSDVYAVSPANNDLLQWSTVNNRWQKTSNLTVNGNTILSNVNVLGASYDGVSFSVAAEEATPTGVFFSPNGLRMYVTGTAGDDVNEYHLSTAWDVSSAIYSTVFSVSAQDTSPSDLFFRADGTKMYVLGNANDTVFQYTLTTPWSVATASYDGISFSVTTQEINPTGLTFKPNGLAMYVAGATGDAVYQYTLSTAWNVSSATFLQSFSVAGQESNPNAVTFTDDGSRMFVMGQSGDDINIYNLTTPWDISTASFVGVFSVASQDAAPQGLYIKPDGTKMYMVGSTNDTVYQYTVPSIDIQLTGPTSAAALEVQQDLTVYGNTAGSFLNNGFRENIAGQYYNLVSQHDIGTAPNEIPLNQYLGSLAYQDSNTVNISGGTVVVASATATSLKVDTAITNVSPSLNLNFARARTIDPRITFTRASTATYYDGVTTAKAEQNLLLYSQEFNQGAQWGLAAATVTANSVSAPDSTPTADTLTASASTAEHSINSVTFNATSSQRFAVSVFAKKGTNDFIQLAVGNQAGTYANFNLATGATGTTAGVVSTSITETPAGTGWYRITMVFDYSSSVTSSLYIVLIDSATAARRAAFTAAGTESVYLWGAQIEQRSAVSSYTATTTQTITNYIPAMQTAANNVARLDYNPTTNEALGLLIEEQRTNLLTYSADFSNAAWAKSNCDITSNTIVAPDGTLTGDQLVENTATLAHIVQRPTSVPPGVHTVSIYIKPAGRNFALMALDAVQSVGVNLLTGTVVETTGSNVTASMVDAGNGWWRVVMTATVTATRNLNIYPSQDGAFANRSYTGNGYSGIYIWGAQLEAGAFPTSHIPTVATQVTRSADMASMTGANFSSWYNQGEGTVFAEAQVGNYSNTPALFSFSDGTSTGNTIQSSVSSLGVPRLRVTKDTVTIVNNINSGTTIAVNTPFKVACSFAVNDFAFDCNAGVVATQLSGVLPTPTQLIIADYGASGSQANSHIRQLTYFPERLSDAELQEMTS